MGVAPLVAACHLVRITGKLFHHFAHIAIYTSFNTVTSGGQLMRIGRPTLPIPRDTYIFDFPILYRPSIYLLTVEANEMFMLPILKGTTCPPCVWPLNTRSGSFCASIS